MKIKVKQPLALAAAMLFLLLAAFFGVYTVHRSLDTYATTVAEITDHERRVAEISVLFKTQVQEWKNTLLRGHDPKALDKHWSAFMKREGEVGQRTRALLEHLPAGEARTHLEKFVAEHTLMGQNYRKGHAAFLAAGFDPTAGDSAVTGMDRAPTQLLGQVGDQIQAMSRAISEDAAAGGRKAIVISLACARTSMAWPLPARRSRTAST